MIRAFGLPSQAVVAFFQFRLANFCFQLLVLSEKLPEVSPLPQQAELRQVGQTVSRSVRDAMRLLFPVIASESCFAAPVATCLMKVNSGVRQLSYHSKTRLGRRLLLALPPLNLSLPTTTLNCHALGEDFGFNNVLYACTCNFPSVVQLFPLSESCAYGKRSHQRLASDPTLVKRGHIFISTLRWYIFIIVVVA